MSEPIQTIKYSEIIANQSTINIITAGHVAHGKSTLVKDITGVKTQKHKSEEKRNITINLGYANAKLYQCPTTGKIVATPSHAPIPRNPETGEEYLLKKHISFVDCPGHESLMSTMISGTNNIDVIFLLVAGNDKVIPQAQTYEHLLVLSTLNNLDHFLILHNKLDLISEKETLENLEKIKEFIKGSPVEQAPIIPISAQLKVNIDQIYQYLIHEVPNPIKDYRKPAQMAIIRSFNVNKPNINIEGLKGGVVGGSLRQGTLRINDIIEIRPGIVTREQGVPKCRPLIAKVTSLFSEQNPLQVAVSGGLLGVGLSLDPGLAKSNAIVGQVLGHIGTLPEIYLGFTIKYRRLNRFNNNSKKIQTGEKVKICAHATNVQAKVTNIQLQTSSSNSNSKSKSKEQIIQLELESPVCFAEYDKVTILRMVDKKWKLDGKAEILEKVSLPEKDLVQPFEYDKYLEEFQIQPLEIIYDIDDKNKDLHKANGEHLHKANGEHLHKANGTKYDYETLLKNIPFKSQIRQQTLELPIPLMTMLPKQSVLTNFSKYIEVLNFYQGEEESPIPAKVVVDPKISLMKFIAEEGCTKCFLNGENQLIINSKFRPNQMETILAKYINEYIYCSNCQMRNSFLYREKGLTYQYCNYCNSTRNIS